MSKRAGIVGVAAGAALAVVGLAGPLVLDSGATTRPVGTTAEVPTSAPPGNNVAVPATGAYFGIWRGPGPGRTVDGQDNVETCRRSSTTSAAGSRSITAITTGA